jgi:NADH-quinone oxidoreductase subunit M
VILSAVYMLWMFQRVNYGELTNEKNHGMRDLTPREWSMMIPTIALAIFMGVFPAVFLRPMEPSVNRLIDRVVGAQPAQVSGPGGQPAHRSAQRGGGGAGLPAEARSAEVGGQGVRGPGSEVTR